VLSVLPVTFHPHGVCLGRRLLDNVSYVCVFFPVLCVAATLTGAG